MGRLILGDCLEEMARLPDNSIDLCLTDPPYGTTACKWDNVIPFEPMWLELKRIVKDNGAICLFGSEPFSSALRMSNIKMFKYDWVWEKDRAANVFTMKKQVGKVHEIISIFYKKQACYYPIMEDSVLSKTRPKSVNNNIKSLNESQGKMETHGQTELFIDKNYDRSKRYPRSVIYFNKNHRGKRHHPTQKPVALLEYLIKTYTLENETVLDFTMGSGSTGVACKNLNRQFIGIEKDKEYFEIAKKRIEDA